MGAKIGVVLGILVLGVVGWLVFTDQKIDSNPTLHANQRAKSEEELLRSALSNFRKSAGRFPTKDEGLDILYMTAHDGPFIRDPVARNDPWGNPYQYRPRADGQDFDLYSKGPNGLDDEGSGDDVR